jgi:hypothetical protein
MKELIILSSLLITDTLSAQTDAKGEKTFTNPHASSAEGAYTSKSVVLRAGVEFPSLLSRYTVFSNNKEVSIPVSVMLDIGVSKEISIRGYLGYSSVSSSQDIGYGVKYEESYTFTVIGAGMTYHFESSSKIDPYIGALLGYNIVSGDFRTSGSSSSSLYTPTVSFVTYSAHVGANCMLNPNFGLFAELGYGLSIIKTGVCIKF